MNPFEFVLVLMFMIFVFAIVKHRMGIPDSPRRRDGSLVDQEDSAETLQLREEVKTLKDRIQVLERITVEKENSLARQIEELRDR